MANRKTKSVAEFGDFQTPRSLAETVCALLADVGVTPASIVEPTCGVGVFLFAAADRWPSCEAILGFDVNTAHLGVARRRAAERSDSSRIRVECANFFGMDWQGSLGGLPEPILVVGNLPWVTNAHVSSLGGSNVPRKSNFQGHNGLDAITGKANFDISEFMLIKLANALAGRRAALAMLVKTAVARKLLLYCWTNGISLDEASIYKIDASAHFDAAIDASLIVLKFGRSNAGMTANVYGQLARVIHPVSTIGFIGGAVVADSEAYQRTQHLGGASQLKWRSGIKHDCSKIMELHVDRGQLRNGLGEALNLESEYLFPMLKTSDVAGGNVDTCTRWMVVPQRRIGDDTAEIAKHAPRTWDYLHSHRKHLDKRGSSIYRDKPGFSIFGVGAYSFAPWKIAISGMYKSLRFVKVGLREGKPVVFDDTTNFMPCPSEEAASLLLSMLESEPARLFFQAFIFWDAKRPITVELLNRLNLYALASQLGTAGEFVSHFGEMDASPRARRRRQPASLGTPSLWSA